MRQAVETNATSTLKAPCHRSISRRKTKATFENRHAFQVCRNRCEKLKRFLAKLSWRLGAGCARRIETPATLELGRGHDLRHRYEHCQTVASLRSSRANSKGLRIGTQQEGRLGFARGLFCFAPFVAALYTHGERRRAESTFFDAERID